MAPLLLFLILSTPLISSSTSHPHSNSTSPESTLHHFHAQLNHSLSRFLLLQQQQQQQQQQQCLTGNPIDDCWRCSSDPDPRRLASCSVGFGRNALGGLHGPTYVVTDSSDSDPVTPLPGTLRYGAIQEGPLWITFSSSMTIRLSQELLINSFKTIDGRGADVHIAGGACLTLQYVSHVILHNLHVHDCVPTGNALVRSTPTHAGFRSVADGDAVSIYASSDLWIDHCTLHRAADGLLDAIMGSTRITVSNSHFSHHDHVMLLGHSDAYLPDSAMQVTLAFNRFGPGLVQRMPHCRRGYVHVVNNDYLGWEMYAVGGSGGPTVNSQGNRYAAPADPNAKEVTKREADDWSRWNWRTEGDVMLNGAFFVPSGEGMEAKYAMAESVAAKAAAMIDQLTVNAGAIGSGSSNDGEGGVNDNGSDTDGGGNGSDSGGSSGGGYYGKMIFGSGTSPALILPYVPLPSLILVVALLYRL